MRYSNCCGYEITGWYEDVANANDGVTMCPGCKEYCSAELELEKDV